MAAVDAEQNFASKKKPSNDEEKRRKKIVPGSLKKAVMRPGGGTAKPADGDQVIFHCTVRTLDGVIVESTRSQYGGRGNPTRLILGKSKMILGLLEGIPTMLKGEVAMFKMKPELHYGEVDCPVAVSESFPKHDELHFEIELTDFFKVKVSTFIYNHGHALQMLREKCGGDLVRPGITRFATNYIALKSFEAKKPRLRAMFASTEWFAWRGSDTPAGRAARETINSEGFWHDVKKVVTLLEPLVKVLRMVDSEKKPTLPHLYAAIDMMKRHVHAAIPRGGKRYLEIIQTRWEKMLMHPMHKAAYYLNPKYQYKCKLGLVQELVDAVQVVVEKLEPNSRMQSKCNQEVISEDFGVLKQVLNEGQGWESPREPYEVKARISAKTGDGKMIVSHTEGEPLFFNFGKAEVPRGLEMGIGTMAREEKAIIYVTKPYLTRSPLLPEVEGFDEVQFEVELVHFIQVRDMLGDGRLIKRRIRDGRGEFPMDCPLHDSLLRVHYKGMLRNEEKTVFYDTRVNNNGHPLEFSSGEGLVPEGFEMCVRLMLPGEMALVTCPPDYAYDKFARPANVPEGAHVQWEIELLDFKMPKDWTGLNFNRIMDDAEKIKNTGNRLFKEGKYELAKAKYEKVLREFNHVHPQDDEEGKIFLNSRNSLHLNVAACYLKMGDCKKSIEACNKVLDTNPVHVKALYRRGMAYMEAGDFQEARDDFTKIISIDKSSESDATAALLKLKQKEQEVDRKARRQFKGLFDKKPGEIAEVTNDTREDQNPEDEKHSTDDQTKSDGDNTEEPRQDADPMPPMGLFSRFWPAGRRLFTALGLERCTIL